MVAPGTNITAAMHGSTNGYVSKNGTSMSSPAVTGIHALMLDAYYTTGDTNGGELAAVPIDMGAPGYDMNYGNGMIDIHESIKRAGGWSYGSFSSGGFYGTIYDTATAGFDYFYKVNVNRTGADLNVTLLNPTENRGDVDLMVWNPGTSPQNGDDPAVVSENGWGDPQDMISIPNYPSGEYIIVVRAYHDTPYSLDISY
ncbi:hypothetical protein CBW46_012050 [Paenibacillus xerothermodurans]|uniref:Peptidase S8/S53 domain-containing protein n=1 Tax=Paenibacillus xerothermodurans TaxID=1977292 RepID=A0A2W1NYA3_PAEXE|nr:hypothetical protein CBW46_012050 [Paenibacillus xerothermodurans]